MLAEAEAGLFVSEEARRGKVIRIFPDTGTPPAVLNEIACIALIGFDEVEGVEVESVSEAVNKKAAFASLKLKVKSTKLKVRNRKILNFEFCISKGVFSIYF